MIRKIVHPRWRGPQGSDADWETWRMCVQEAATLGRGELQAGSVLVQTDETADAFWQRYLKAIELAGLRVPQHDCAACRRFMELYGRLYVLNPTGHAHSLLWGRLREKAPLNEYVPADGHLAQRTAKPLVPADLPPTPYEPPYHARYTHFTMPMLRMATPRPSATTREILERLWGRRRVTPLSPPSSPRPLPAREVLELARTFTADVHEARHLTPIVEWLLTVQQASSERYRQLYIAATAPEAWTHYASGILGALLKDLEKEGYEEARHRFLQRSCPLTYRRPQAPPTVHQQDAADAVIQKLGVASSLRRRRATFTELTYVHPLATIDFATTVRHAVRTTATKATLCDFLKRYRLPSPHKRYAVRVPNDLAYFTGFTTAVDPLSPPILKWDSPPRRNPISTYTMFGGSTTQEWGILPGLYALVGVCFPPEASPRQRQSLEVDCVHFVFRANPCGPEAPAHPLGLFPETLKEELRPAFRAIEAYSQRHVLGMPSRADCAVALTVAQGSAFAPITLYDEEQMITITEWGTP